MQQLQEQSSHSLVVWFDWLILSNQPEKLSAIAAIAGLIGVGLLVLRPGAGAIGLGTVLVNKWQPNVSVIVLTAWQLAIAGLMLLPVAQVSEMIIRP